MSNVMNFYFQEDTGLVLKEKDTFSNMKTVQSIQSSLKIKNNATEELGTYNVGCIFCILQIVLYFIHCFIIWKY